MAVHELKSDSDQFQKHVTGVKRFELRINDRNFRVGDTLLLRETVHSGLDMALRKADLVYTGQMYNCRVCDVLYGPAYGLPEGMCIMSLYGGFLVPDSLKEIEMSNLQKVCEGRPVDTGLSTKGEKWKIEIDSSKKST